MFQYRKAEIFRGGVPVAISLGKGTQRRSIPIHSHDFWELVFVVSGCTIHNLKVTPDNELSYALVTGDVFVICPGESHLYSDSRNVTYFNVMFDFDYVAAELAHLENLPAYPMLFAHDRLRYKIHLALREREVLAEQLQSIANELSTRRPGYEAFVHAALVESLITILRSDPVRQTGDAGYDYSGITRCIGLMEQHPEKNYPVSELAKTAGISESYFYVRFQEVTGVSPNEYYMSLRLANAGNILLHSTKSIGEIAADCGFCDSTHFIKNFRKRYGVTPGQFRKQFLT